MTRKESVQKNYMRKRLGVYLTQLREEKKVSIRRVAEETGISDPFLYQIEKGEKSLNDPEYFNTLAKYYGVKVEELLRQAGYLPLSDADAELEAVVQTIVDDSKVDLGPSFFAKLDFTQKLEVVSLYEKATGKKLLTPFLRALR